MNASVPLVVLVGFLAGGAATGAAETPVREPLLDVVSARLLAAKGLPGLAVAVLEKDRVVHLDGYGAAWLSPARAVEVGTLFDFASISKQFAAAAVMKLVEDGQLGLDDVVADHLPEVGRYGRDIRLRHLLAQTAGLPEFLDLPGFPPLARKATADSSLAEVLAFVGRAPLRFSPGTRWAYSNSNYTALALLVERVSSRPYPDFLAERVLTPAGLDAIVPCDRLPREGWAMGYRSAPDGAKAVPHDANAHTYTGNGDLCGTAADLARFTRALATGRLVSAESYRRMTTPEPVGDGYTPPYGFGLSLVPLAGRRAVSHTGSAGTAAAYFPESDTTVVVLTNREKSWAEEPLQEIARAVLGTPAPPPPDPGLVTWEEAAPFVGRYDDGLFRFRVDWRAGRLELDNPPFGPPRLLGRVGVRRFASMVEPEGIALERPPDGVLPGILFFDWGGGRSFARRTFAPPAPAKRP